MTATPRFDTEIQSILETHRNGRVLVVDDQPSMRRVCTFALRGEGLYAEGETSPIKALNRLMGGEPFDAVVLDHAMPELEGLEVIRALAPGQHPPIVFASAHADAEVARAAMQMGVWDFIAKPFTPAALRRAVQRLLLRPNLIAQGDRRALALHLANRRRWPAAREALGEATGRDEKLLLGLLWDVDGQPVRAARCFTDAGWPATWIQGGPETWAALAQRLDF